MKRDAQVPDGWMRATLRDQLDLCRNGLVCQQDADSTKGLPVTRIETISEGKINWNRVGYVLHENANSEYLLRQGDILLSHINSVKHIGKVARKTDDRPLLHGMNLMVLRCAQHLDPGFAFAVMSSHRTKSYMESRAKKAVNQASINRQDIFALPILLPPLPEQRAIAAVLDSIDEAIERTEAVIAATERLRDALLHELLTRGVPGWHSEWKEAPGIGAIPASWDVVQLGDVAEVLGGSTPSRKERTFWRGNIPWVVPSELTELKGRYLMATKESITDEGMKAAGLKLIPAGSVLLTSRATVGVTAINAIPVVTNQGFLNFVVKNGIDTLWLYYRVSALRREFQKRAAGSTFLEVSRDSARSLPIVLPPLPEQQAIAAMLDSTDAAIDRAREERDGLQSLKASTSDALLTGRVRVDAESAGG